jgi:hypothetical protein
MACGFCVVLEHANKLIQELDPESEERRKLQEDVDRELSRYTSVRHIAIVLLV